MQDSLFEAIKAVVFFPRSVDNHGLTHHMPVDLLIDLEHEFKKYCRKHGVKREKCLKSSAST